MLGAFQRCRGADTPANRERLLTYRLISVTVEKLHSAAMRIQKRGDREGWLVAFFCCSIDNLVKRAV